MIQNPVRCWNCGAPYPTSQNPHSPKDWECGDCVGQRLAASASTPPVSIEEVGEESDGLSDIARAVINAFRIWHT